MRHWLLVGLLALSGCGPVPAPQPPQPPPSWVLTLESSPAGVTITAVDGPARELCVTPCTITLPQQGFTIRAHKEGYIDPPWQPVTLIGPVTISFTLTPLEVSLPVIHADRRIFRLPDGTPWRWKGVSSFALLDRFAKGQDISGTLTAYRGFNVLRVWTYVPVKDWGAKAWTSPAPEVIVAFLKRVAQDGFYVELTLLTDDDPARAGPARAQVQALVAARPTNLFIEIGNEPTTHKNIDTAAFRGLLDGSGFLYASGNYEESSKAFGGYLVAHTARDVEWPRRIHDFLDFFNGRGPNAPTDPAHKVPGVGDEPAKLQDVGGDHVKDWLAYFGGCGLLASGCTFHSETGKFGLPPTGEEIQLAAAALAGLNAFPADAPLGAYNRPADASLRTYIVGKCMVRIRPTTATPPGSGWVKVGDSGILWKRP